MTGRSVIDLCVCVCVPLSVCVHQREMVFGVNQETAQFVPVAAVFPSPIINHHHPHPYSLPYHPPPPFFFPCFVFQRDKTLSFLPSLPFFASFTCIIDIPITFFYLFFFYQTFSLIFFFKSFFLFSLLLLLFKAGFFFFFSLSFLISTKRLVKTFIYLSLQSQKLSRIGGFFSLSYLLI